MSSQGLNVPNNRLLVNRLSMDVPKRCESDDGPIHSRHASFAGHDYEPHPKALWQKVQVFTQRIHRRMAEITPQTGPQASSDWIHFLQYQQTQNVEDRNFIDPSQSLQVSRRSHGNLNYLSSQNTAIRTIPEFKLDAKTKYRGSWSHTAIIPSTPVKNNLLGFSRRSSKSVDDKTIDQITPPEFLKRPSRSIQLTIENSTHKTLKSRKSSCHDENQMRKSNASSNELISPDVSSNGDSKDPCVGFITLPVPSVTNKLPLRKSNSRMSCSEDVGIPRSSSFINQKFNVNSKMTRHSLGTVVNIWDTLPYAHLRNNRYSSSFSSPSPEKNKKIFARFMKTPSGGCSNPLRYITSFLSKKDAASAPSLVTSTKGVVCSARDFEDIRNFVYSKPESVNAGELSGQLSRQFSFKRSKKPSKQSTKLDDAFSKNSKDSVKRLSLRLPKIKKDRRSKLSPQRAQSTEIIHDDLVKITNIKAESENLTMEIKDASIPNPEILGRAIQLHLESCNQKSAHHGSFVGVNDNSPNQLLMTRLKSISSQGSGSSKDVTKTKSSISLQH